MLRGLAIAIETIAVILFTVWLLGKVLPIRLTNFLGYGVTEAELARAKASLEAEAEQRRATR